MQHFCSSVIGRQLKMYLSCLPAGRPQSSGHRGERWGGHSHSLRAQLGCPLPHLYRPILAKGTLLLSIGMSRCVATLISECRLPHQTPVCTAPLKLLLSFLEICHLRGYCSRKQCHPLPLLRCFGPAEVLMLNSQRHTLKNHLQTF